MKQQILVLALAVAILCTALTLSAATLYLTDRSNQGAESHAALCVLKADYSKRLDDSQTFLLLNREQREHKYGKALGDIPEPVIRQSLHNLKSNVESLGALHC